MVEKKGCNCRSANPFIGTPTSGIKQRLRWHERHPSHFVVYVIELQILFAFNSQLFYCGFNFGCFSILWSLLWRPSGQFLFAIIKLFVQSLNLFHFSFFFARMWLQERFNGVAKIIDQ
jgi:hypothetical protein